MSAKKKKTTRKKGLGNTGTTRKNTTKKTTSKNILEEIMPLLLTAGGIIGASLAGKMIDKAVKSDDGTDKITIKKLVKPIVLTAGGVALKIFVKDKNIKALADGIAAGGLLSGVKVVLKKDFLSGIDGLGEAEMQTLAQMGRRIPVELSIAHQSYQPDLPVLEAAPDTNEYMSGEESEQPMLLASHSLADADTIDLQGDEVEIL